MSVAALTPTVLSAAALITMYLFFKLSAAALTATVLSAASLISTQFILNERRGLEFYCAERCGLNFYTIYFKRSAAAFKTSGMGAAALARE